MFRSCILMSPVNEIVVAKAFCLYDALYVISVEDDTVIVFAGRPLIAHHLFSHGNSSAEYQVNHLKQFFLNDYSF